MRRVTAAVLAGAGAGLGLALGAAGQARAAGVGAARPAGLDLALMGALAAVSLTIHYGLRRFGARARRESGEDGPENN